MIMRTIVVTATCDVLNGGMKTNQYKKRTPQAMITGVSCVSLLGSPSKYEAPMYIAKPEAITDVKKAIEKMVRHMNADPR
jgi:hypothetical protein